MYPISSKIIKMMELLHNKSFSSFPLNNPSLTCRRGRLSGLIALGILKIWFPKCHPWSLISLCIKKENKCNPVLYWLWSSIVGFAAYTQGRRLHNDVIKRKHFPRYWPFVRGIHRSPVNSSHKGQWRGALMYSLVCVWINGWVNNREDGDLRPYSVHHDVTVMEPALRFKRCH